MSFGVRPSPTFSTGAFRAFTADVDKLTLGGEELTSNEIANQVTVRVPSQAASIRAAVAAVENSLNDCEVTQLKIILEKQEGVRASYELPGNGFGVPFVVSDKIPSLLIVSEDERDVAGITYSNNCLNLINSNPAVQGSGRWTLNFSGSSVQVMASGVSEFPGVTLQPDFSSLVSGDIVFLTTPDGNVRKLTVFSASGNMITTVEGFPGAVSNTPGHAVTILPCIDLVPESGVTVTRFQVKDLVEFRGCNFDYADTNQLWLFNTTNIREENCSHVVQGAAGGLISGTVREVYLGCSLTIQNNCSFVNNVMEYHAGNKLLSYNAVHFCGANAQGYHEVNAPSINSQGTYTSCKLGCVVTAGSCLCVPLGVVQKCDTGVFVNNRAQFNAPLFEASNNGTGVKATNGSHVTTALPQNFAIIGAINFWTITNNVLGMEIRNNSVCSLNASMQASSKVTIAMNNGLGIRLHNNSLVVLPDDDNKFDFTGNGTNAMSGMNRPALELDFPNAAPFTSSTTFPDVATDYTGDINSNVGYYFTEVLADANTITQPIPRDDITAVPISRGSLYIRTSENDDGSQFTT